MLVTCGNMPRSCFTHNLISIAQKPPPDQLQQGRMIHVSYYKKTSWSFRVQDCSTWSVRFSGIKDRPVIDQTGMLTNCRTSTEDFWPRPLQFSHKAQVISESDWARVVNIARHSEVAVVIDIRAG